MFEKILNNYINGNIKDFKKGVKRLSLNQRYELLQYVKNNYGNDFDYFLYTIVTKDF